MIPELPQEEPNKQTRAPPLIMVPIICLPHLHLLLLIVQFKIPNIANFLKIILELMITLSGGKNAALAVKELKRLTPFLIIPKKI